MINLSEFNGLGTRILALNTRSTSFPDEEYEEIVESTWEIQNTTPIETRGFHVGSSTRISYNNMQGISTRRKEVMLIDDRDNVPYSVHETSYTPPTK